MEKLKRWRWINRNKFLSEKIELSAFCCQKFQLHPQTCFRLTVGQIEGNKFLEVVNLFCLKGKTPDEITSDMNKVHGTFSMAFKTDCNVVNEFKRGWTIIGDEQRSGEIHGTVLRD